MVEQADVAIVGAGVVGLAIASQVARTGRRVYILEKNHSFGLETSSHNSQVIHSGIYYPPGWLKATTCVQGNALLYELCARHGIAHRRVGKLIVATETAEVAELETLLERGRANGVQGLRLLSQRELKQREPNVAAVAGLLSPNTGIIDSHALMRYYLSVAQAQGAQVAYRTQVAGIEPAAGGYRVSVEDGSGGFTFVARVLINSAGLFADRVAAMAGLDLDAVGYRLRYCKGDYFSVGGAKGRLINGLVYPAPPARIEGVGIHATVDLDGGMRLGPGIQWVDSIDYSVDPARKPDFYRAARRFLPFLEPDALEPDMAGIRPKLQQPGGDSRDFVIRHEADRGLPGLIDLIGIESPGLTASPAVARLVARMVDEAL